MKQDSKLRNDIRYTIYIQIAHPNALSQQSVLMTLGKMWSCFKECEGRYCELAKEQVGDNLIKQEPWSCVSLVLANPSLHVQRWRWVRCRSH